MKKGIMTIAFFLMMSLCVESVSAANVEKASSSEKKVRILLIGNSLTKWNDLYKKLATISGAKVYMSAFNGVSLAAHLDVNQPAGLSTQNMLANYDWDYIVIQEESNRPITDKEGFLRDTKKMCQLIRAKGAKPVLYATWAYQRFGPALEEFGMTYENMYRQLQEAYKEAATENNMILANAGERIYLLSVMEDLYKDDGLHANNAGSKVAAQVIAEAIMDDVSKDD